MAWVIVRREKGPKDEISYSFYNGNFETASIDGMFEKGKDASVCVFGNERTAGDLSHLFNHDRNYYLDCSVEVFDPNLVWKE